MIRLQVIDDEQQHFLLTADEPMRVEVLPVNGKIIAHIYTGTEVDMEQSPVGAYDGTVDNEDWSIPAHEPTSS